MRILLFLTIFPLVMASISPLVGEKTKAMTPERILELWNLPVKNGDIPEGFNNWMISNQSKVTIEISLPNGEKFNPPPFKLPQKIIQGKYIMWLVAPPGAPFKNYGIIWYEKKSSLYRKSVYHISFDETKEDPVEEMVHFLGMRYPGTNLYAFTQTNNTKQKVKSFHIERHTPEKAEFKEIITNSDNQLERTFRGTAIPIKDEP